MISDHVDISVIGAMVLLCRRSLLLPITYGIVDMCPSFPMFVSNFHHTLHTLAQRLLSHSVLLLLFSSHSNAHSFDSPGSSQLTIFTQRDFTFRIDNVAEIWLIA